MSSTAAAVQEGLVTAPTAAQQLKPYQFKPGQSGNPKGREKGSRNKLSEAFLYALYKDFVKHGVRAIEAMRIESPGEYVRVIAGTLPKDKLFDPEDGNVIWVINAQPSESIEDWASKHGVKVSESHAKAIEHDGNGSGRVEPVSD